MKVKLISIVCSFCSKNFEGRTYQEYCSRKCQELKGYYKKVREKRTGQREEFQEIKCDVCGDFFKPKRGKAKRCSDVCRVIYKREFTILRNEARKKIIREKSPAVECAVCRNVFKAPEGRKTCSRICSKKYQEYKYRKLAKQPEVKHIPEIWPLPETKAIPVTLAKWPPDSADLETATAEFIHAGGKIRKYAPDTETDLLKENSRFEIENIKHEAEDQLFGIVRPS